MTKKSLRLTLYFLAGVAILYLISVLAGGGGGSSRTIGDPDLAAALSQVDINTLTKIELISPTQGFNIDRSINLERAAAGWTVNGFIADSAAVGRLLRAITDVVVKEIAATNPANHERLGMDEANAWVLIPGDEQRILIGDPGSRFRSAYARLPGQDQVSLIEGDLRMAVARPLGQWRDKVIVRSDTAAVNSVHVTRDGETTVYERQDSSWTADGEDADHIAVQQILQELATLRANGFALEDTEMPANPARTVRAFDESGAEIATVFIAETDEEDDGNFWVTSSQSEYIFTIATFRADRVAPEPS